MQKNKLSTESPKTVRQASIQGSAQGGDLSSSPYRGRLNAVIVSGRPNDLCVLMSSEKGGDMRGVKTFASILSRIQQTKTISHFSSHQLHNFFLFASFTSIN